MCSRLNEDLAFAIERYQIYENNTEILKNVPVSPELYERFRVQRDRYWSIICHLVELRTHKRHQRKMKTHV